MYSGAHRLTDNSQHYPLIGRIVAERYEIVGFIGQGAMGAVYKAKHVTMGRICAVKTLNANLLSDEKSVLRFHLEAQAMSVLNHPHLIAISDYGQMDDDSLFFVMEYLEGISLSDDLRKNGPLSIRRAIPIFGQIADAVAHAHSKSLVHRDLKPSNVMLTGDDQDFAKVVDFGIAKIVSDGDDPAQHLTQTGEVFGSPLYMSPEQCMGMPMDGRSDIYSFGCLMYEVLSGRPALKGQNFVQTAYKHMHEMPLPLRELRPDVPENLAAIIEGCLEKKPEDRIPSMSTVRDLLRSVESLGDKAATVNRRSIISEQENTLIEHNASVGEGLVPSRADVSSVGEGLVLSRANVSSVGEGLVPSRGNVESSKFNKIAAIVLGTACVLCAFFLGRNGPPVVTQTSAPKAEPDASPKTTRVQPSISSVSIESPAFSHVNPDAPEEVDVIAVYQAKLPPTEVDDVDETASQGTDAVNASSPPEVTVVIHPKKQPITLVLLSYMPVHWNVQPQSGANILKVVASGYFEQKIETKNNSCADVTKMCNKTHADAFNTAGLFYTDSLMVEQNRKKTYETVAAAVKRMLNKEIRHFEGKFYGTHFDI